MKRKLYKLLTAVILASSFGVALQAQTKSKSDEKLLSEIADFRQRLVRTIEKRDRKTLETLFTDDFTRTRAIGKVDGSETD